MSGEKCVQARLAREIQEQLERNLAERNRLYEVLAGVADVREEWKHFQRDYGSQADRYMPGEACELTAAFKTLDEARRVFKDCLQAIPQTSVLHSSLESVSAIRALLDDAGAKAQHLREHTESLRSRMSFIRENIRSRTDHAHRNLLIQNDRRAGLNARCKALDERMRSDVAMVWVKNEADALRRDVQEALLGPRDITQEQRDAFTRGFDALLEEAADRQRRHCVRLEIADRLAAAFSKSGFQVTSYDRGAIQANSQGSFQAIEFWHKTSGSVYLAQIETVISMESDIDLTMRGASGYDFISLGPDEACAGRLDQIIEKAKALGLNIQAVYLKDPDGGLSLKIYDQRVETRQDAQVEQQSMRRT